MAQSKAAGELARRSCRGCKGEVGRLDDAKVREYVSQLPGWSLDGGEISRTYSFKNYYETMAFVNATAWVSHHEDHHPDLEVGYNYCRVQFTTHAIKGLSENDFICAAKIDRIPLR